MQSTEGSFDLHSTPYEECPREKSNQKIHAKPNHESDAFHFDSYLKRRLDAFHIAAMIRGVGDGSHENVFMRLNKPDGRHNPRRLKRARLEILNSVGVETKRDTISPQPVEEKRILERVQREANQQYVFAQSSTNTFKLNNIHLKLGSSLTVHPLLLL
ncbi:unnamed protein product [Toxocara canis]|uniref:DET1- and DDB1-associated protein 1 n=1 Tax=Toxocara canis TaxID=6265 RepID=A0A183TZ34_TOXCA|nr:unnamed protein product [Toxocara canis]